jgi:probable rRNA maturation factor
MTVTDQCDGLEIHVQVASSCKSVPSPKNLRTWVRCALGSSLRGALTVRIVDEPEGAELNERYRHVRGATNVLAFPAGESILPPTNELPPAGDLVICAPVLEREARAQRKSLEAYWAHISIHGALHLLGLDHGHDEEARVMEAKEIELLKSLGFAATGTSDG